MVEENIELFDGKAFDFWEAKVDEDKTKEGNAAEEEADVLSDFQQGATSGCGGIKTYWSHVTVCWVLHVWRHERDDQPANLLKEV